MFVSTCSTPTIHTQCRVPRGQIRAALFGATAISLAACTSIPPVWPLSEMPSPALGYPTVSGSPQACEPSTSPALTSTPPTPDQSLYCAQLHAATVAAKFAREQRTIEAVKNGETLTLFGVGTAAGIEGIVTKAVTPARNLGLAAVALAGLDSALGVSGQRKAYEAAATSMACIIRTDAALQTAMAAVMTQMSAVPNGDLKITAGPQLMAGVCPRQHGRHQPKPGGASAERRR